MQEAAAAGTWAQGGAGCFLDILPLTEGAPVERRRVGAAPAPFLPAAPTAGAADGPLGPRRPPTVHWPDREGLGSGSGGFLRHAGPGTRAGGPEGKPRRGGHTVPTAPSFHLQVLRTLGQPVLTCSSQAPPAQTPAFRGATPASPPSACSWGCPEHYLPPKATFLVSL